MQKTYIGIDFGTTNTAVIGMVVDELGAVPKQINLAEEGDLPFSSIVAIPKNDNYEYLFGRSVKAHRFELSKTHHIIPSIKSFLNDQSEIVTEDGKRFSCVQITTMFLCYIKKFVKENYKIDITEATFSFPVDFKPEAREALRNAAERSGITVNGFISESTAAYISNREQSKAYSKVLVLDWGGGTLDISLLKCVENKLYELSVMGEKIGGDDIDKLLSENMHSKLAKMTNLNISYEDMDANLKDLMTAKCEKAKIDFEIDDETDILLPNYGDFGSKSIELCYEEFSGIIKPIINRTIKTIETALKQGETTPQGVDAVILVGGSSELRLFYEVISQIFGEDKILSAEKRQWSVALGAALIDISGGEYYLNDDVSVELSDDLLFPILKKDQAKVGDAQNSISFSLTEDALDAHFIFKNSMGNINYGIVNVNTKGFLTEKLVLTSNIDINQIANIVIENKAMGDNYTVTHRINKLKFYYDLTKI